MNETTKNFLNIDPRATDETLIDERHEYRNVKTDDTHFGITWQEFVEIARAYGFESGFCQKFIGTGMSDEESIEEEEIIFFHEEKGLILYAESVDRNSVNTATVYGEVKINETLTENQWYALRSCSCGSNENGTMYFDVDVREGLRFHLDAISEAFEFSKNWTKVPFLWFLNYMDIKKKKYKCEEISKEKINACTPEVQKIIFG